MLSLSLGGWPVRAAGVYAKTLVENLVHHAVFLAMLYLNRDTVRATPGVASLAAAPQPSDATRRKKSFGARWAPIAVGEAS